MLEIVPDTGQLSQWMAQAAAPAFVLGAVAGFVSILQGQLTGVVNRIRTLNDIPDDDTARAQLKCDLPHLRQRIRLLRSAVLLALASGFCTSLLLLVGFVSSFFRFQHIYGAALLFVLAVGLLGGSLFRFGQEVMTGLSEADHYR
jgi:hypothetical protein